MKAVHYYVLALNLCVASHMPMHGMESRERAAIATKFSLSSMLYDKRTLTAAAALLVGATVWYLWKNYKAARKLTIIEFPSEENFAFSFGTNRKIKPETVSNIVLKKYENLTKLIDDFLSNNNHMTLTTLVNNGNVHSIINTGDLTFIANLQEWFGQFKEFFPSEKTPIQNLITDLTNLTEQTQPQQGSSLSQLSTTEQVGKILESHDAQAINTALKAKGHEPLEIQDVFIMLTAGDRQAKLEKRRKALKEKIPEKIHAIDRVFDDLKNLTPGGE